MLLQFSITNHRSIKETAIISMKAAADKTMKEVLISPDGKKELVPVMAIYGANAAGKSNVYPCASTYAGNGLRQLCQTAQRCRASL